MLARLLLPMPALACWTSLWRSCWWGGSGGGEGLLAVMSALLVGDSGRDELLLIVMHVLLGSCDAGTAVRRALLFSL